MNKHFSIYVHIPFCVKKCGYCDFISYENENDLTDEYFLALNREIVQNANIYQSKVVDTIFIGGGTPSFVDAKYIATIMSNLKKHYNISENCEISIESNPNSITKEKLQKYKDCGINRVSIGVQSTSECVLKEMGRSHSASDISRAIDQIRCIGFANFNIDIMFAVPKQSFENLVQTLNDVLSFEPTHISAYSLILEEGTAFFDKYHDREITDEDEEREMYYYIREKLEENGYNQYEISNFAKDGYECQHNLYCWQMEEYVGFGLNAHSYVSHQRFSNEVNLKRYIDKISCGETSIIEVETMDITQEINDAIMLALRTNEGINTLEFNENFDIDFMSRYEKQINKLKSENLIIVKQNNISLTKEGMDVNNYIIGEFID